MSMDDTYNELRRFAKELEEFNETLNDSVKALTDAHDQLDGLWQDAFRREYDQRWDSFSKEMDRYQSSVSNQYEEFLKDKIQQLKAYLND